MKTLLLASNGQFLFDTGFDLLGIPKEQIRILYVTTAAKGVENQGYLERHKLAMTKRGYQFEEIDIEGKTQQQLQDAIKGKNIIHVEGGNTFYLLKAVRQSGFDKILKEAVDSGIVYAGTSAGSYIACPTIETSTWGPKVKDRYGLEDLTGLNFVPFILKAHYTDDTHSLIKEKMVSSKYPLRILRDGQGLLATDDTYQFVGEGVEVDIVT